MPSQIQSYMDTLINTYEKVFQLNLNFIQCGHNSIPNSIISKFATFFLFIELNKIRRQIISKIHVKWMPVGEKSTTNLDQISRTVSTSVQTRNRPVSKRNRHQTCRRGLSVQDNTRQSNFIVRSKSI